MRPSEMSSYQHQRMNNHLKEHLPDWSEWPNGIKMMLNNLLSIELCVLASSQGDFIFQDRADVSCPAL